MFDLRAFLRRHKCLAEGSATWGDGTLQLHISAYLADELPPIDLVTSVRSLVFRNDSMLVLRNQHSTHVLPGGRREAGETLEAALRREILEETGWTIQAPSLLGFLHLQHLSPKPPDYLYPYPDFFQVIYFAEADRFDPSAKLLDDYEQEAEFRGIDDAWELDPANRPLLEAASRARSER